jgi:S-DNA-T family DNA segregation ATPase FtsK/SpoIIIE
MPAKKPASNAPASSIGRKRNRPRPFFGLTAMVFGILGLLALADYDPHSQVSWHNTEAVANNLVGEFGVRFASGTLWAVGAGAYLIPLFAYWLAYMFFRPHAAKLRLAKIPPLLLILASAAVFASLYQIDFALRLDPGPVNPAAISDNFFNHGWGGWIGYLIYADFLRQFLGMVGTSVVFGILGCFSLMLLLIDNVGHDIGGWIERRWDSWKAGAGERRKRREERAAAKRKAALEHRKQKLEGLKARKSAEGTEDVPPSKAPASTKTERPALAEEDAVQPFAPIIEELPPDAPPAKPKPAAPAKPTLAMPTATAEPSAANGPAAGALRIIAGEQVRKATAKLPEKKGDYAFPPMRLLSEPASGDGPEDASVHEQTAEALVRTLDEFGVKVSTGDVHIGPVITRYDVHPAAGVRVEKILNLDRNIALNLKAQSVRILAPVPGKGCVGIEIPNRSPQAVYIRDILESEDWVNTKAEIPIALGKDVSGKPLIADLTKMPHLLIAGSTGSGKTVCINSIITSLLYHSSPDDLRFVMVDPKIVEMQVYNALPHMLVPVVTDPKKVPNALKYLLNEMERRYQMFAGVGVRNIAGYNAKMASSKREAQEAEERAAAMDAAMSPEERAAAASIEVPRQLDFMEQGQPERLPYIVCIVDELADLMMVAPADIETGIARLAQLARAAGIHLILATQRPSVNVITGVIKANLPSRIAFKVASKVDSRTILDTMGADQLIGKGDMLFLPPGSADLQRAQGAFVGDDEINGIVDHISQTNGPPQFDEQFQQNIEAGDEDSPGGDDGDWDDDLVPQAIEVIRTSKRASTSMLQRRLKIGYNRAARIMEILEQEGMVGPENGSSPREILMPLD